MRRTGNNYSGARWAHSTRDAATARHEARMDQRRPVLVARLNDLGYTAREAGLGGNITGIEVATLSGHAWVITDDHGDWLIGSDDEDRTDDSPVASASLGEAIEVVTAWADQIMGFDRPNHKEST